LHVAFVAPSRAAVDVFYRAAIEAGAPTTARRDWGPLPRQLLRRLRAGSQRQQYRSLMPRPWMRAVAPGSRRGVDDCLLRPATKGDLASNLVAMSAVGTKRT